MAAMILWHAVASMASCTGSHWGSPSVHGTRRALSGALSGPGHGFCRAVPRPQTGPMMSSRGPPDGYVGKTRPREPPTETRGRRKSTNEHSLYPGRR